MLKRIHRALLRFPLTRRVQLRSARWIKWNLGVSDPYYDLLALAKRLQPVAILDIGSFVGDTIEFLVQGTRLPIHGFEPTPESFQRLASRYAGNSQVHLHPIALSDRSGEIEIFCNRNPQTNSILDNDVGNTSAFPDQTAHVTKRSVAVTTLDAWMSAHIPHGNILIKSDVQGAEGLLLDGGSMTFATRVLGFYSEAQLGTQYAGQTDLFHLHQRLCGIGFVLHNLYACHQDKSGRATQTDALWA